MNKNIKKKKSKKKSNGAQKRKINEIVEKVKIKFNMNYLSYSKRVLICIVTLIIVLVVDLLFFYKTLDLGKEKVVEYQELGNIDYKVYLKNNEFYNEKYLDKDQYYIASIIDNINIDLNYKFLIQERVNAKFSYKIMGKLIIADGEGKNELYQKEYVLKDDQEISNIDRNTHNIKDNIVIDYDYYNNLANNFKSTYGLDAVSSLTVYMVVNKDVENEKENINLNDSSQMNLTIPLTQKTLDIKIDNTQINQKGKIINETKITFVNILCGIISIGLFFCMSALVLRLVELLFLLVPKKSKYDKYIKKILNEYDRLIVESTTEPQFANKEIIKIDKFEELIDVIDNLKKPIMYYNLIDHQKCYFYVKNENEIYLLTIKAVDLEKINNIRRKK